MRSLGREQCDGEVAGKMNSAAMGYLIVKQQEDVGLNEGPQTAHRKSAINIITY
jgi:hypothetical protein